MNIRRIVYPTDFSSCADNALDFAVAVAAAFQSDLFLVHAYHESYNPHVPVDELIEANEEKKTKAEEKLKGLESCIYEKNKNIVVNRFARQGPGEEAVLEFIKEQQADLVVLGTHGTSGVREVLYGSFAGKILEQANCPVLVIPDQAVFKNFSSLVYASDKNEIDLAAIKNLISFTHKFNSRIRIVHVAADMEDASKGDAFNDLLQNSVQGEFEFVTIKGRDVNRLIADYLEERPADLLVMTALKKSLFGRLFHPGHSRRMAYHTTVPLLVFHESDQCCQGL